MNRANTLRSSIDLTRFVGIPYVDKGIDPATGLDCWQLVKLFQKEVMGVIVPDYLELYSSAMDHARIAAVMDAEFPRWEKHGAPEYGDVLIFRIVGNPWHAGCYIGDNLMLHTLPGKNSCVELFNGLRWRHRFFGAYKWKS